MALTLPTYALVSILLGVLALAVLAGVFARRWKKAESDLMNTEIDKSSVEADIGKGKLVELPPPLVKTDGMFGETGQRIGLWWHFKKRRRLLQKGYVQWLLLDDGWPMPKFVKPVSEGGGIPEFEYDGTTYLFPKRAMLPDETTGLWTVLHRRGESDPVNLRMPNELALPADMTTEYLTTRVTDEAPSFFDKWDIDGQGMMYILIGVTVALSVIGYMLAGGVP